MLKILIAPASYKGSIAAHSLAAAIARGCQDAALADMHKLYGDFSLIEMPIADGGDDTVMSINLALGGALVERPVTGPTGQTVQALYLKLPGAEPGFAAPTAGETAIVELARASGIAYLTADQLRPLDAHTYGTGQLIKHAIAGGAKKVIVAVGGSASTDGGTGALSALGAKFKDRVGNDLSLGGGGLLNLAEIDLSELLVTTRGVDFVIATDVTSPLLGPSGAAAVFAPQKGAGPAEVLILERALANFKAVAQSQYGENIQTLSLLPGAGAAGGAGFGFAALLNAQIVSGFHFLADLLGMEQKIQWCDLIIVAEGRLDKQSLSGKGVGEIINLAAALGKTVIVLPALSELTGAELAAQMHSHSSKIMVLPTAQNGLATVNDVQAATTKAILATLIE